jgi:hypothetical protein
MNIDDGEIHDVFDPYPPPNTQASYWPDKKLEDEIRQLSFNSERNATSNVDESGVVHTVINHAWQFFRTMWPQVSRNVGLMNSKHNTRAITALIYKKAHKMAEALKSALWQILTYKTYVDICIPSTLSTCAIRLFPLSSVPKQSR